MNSTNQLHDYLLANAMNMTERWLNTREKDGSTYDENAPLETVAIIKKQNQEFIKIVANSLVGESNYTEWAGEVGANRARSNTELSDVLKNFKKFRAIFMSYLVQYSQENHASIGELGNWINQINYTFDHIIELTSFQYQRINQEYMQSHREMVLELSSPVIPIHEGIGILPLVGSIDTYRAKVIREKTLQQAANLDLQSLIIDLSGVPIVDTMVANELFQVFKALALLGINAALTGISPAIAQTSVQLGLDFSKIPTFANLSQALAKMVKA
jgi:rsbT co-antagonist protein RsbR